VSVFYGVSYENSLCCPGEEAVPGYQIFIIRAALGIVVGVFIYRVFYTRAPLIFTFGLCAALVALAYLTEYLRRRKK
jgi:hypothetical protein